VQVTSRNSVLEYRGTSKNIRQIGTELGVQTLLQGQVQRAGSQVHVTVQLVDAASDRQIWAESYDRELTAQNIFTIQGDIAGNVAQALRASFTSSEIAAAQNPPTQNLESLDWFHRGQATFANRSGSLTDTATVHAFERAIALDSGFAQAWAGLAVALSWRVRNGFTTDTLPARRALDRAAALAPASPDTKIAQAYYAYYAQADYAAALALFKAVAVARPSDVDAIAGIGYIARRRGHWNEALASERKRIELDPRSASALLDMGATYMMTRQWAQAEEMLRRSRILDPAGVGARGWLLFTLVAGHGDTAAARALIAELGPGSSTEALAYTALLERLARNFDSSTEAYSHARRVRPIDGPEMLIAQALNDVASGAGPRARARADSAARQARAYLDSTPGTGVFGSRADFHTVIGMAEAIQGRAAAAIRAGELAVELNPVTRDATEGPRSVDGLIAIHLLLGHREDAIRLILEQADGPTSVSSSVVITQASLGLDPLFDPIRSDPRIQALLRDPAAWVVQ
jgi:tetratricopeptide (TPR) repeat protein